MRRLEREKRELLLAYTEFCEVVVQLEPSQRDQPGVSGHWSPKDVIAHLIGWDAALQNFISDPESFNPEPLYDVHTFNQQSVTKRQNQTWAETIEEWERAFADLQEAIATITSDMKMYGRVRDWLGGRRDDYVYHTDQLVWWSESPVPE